MKFSSALFLISVVLGVRTLSAQEPKYFEEGKTLTLEIDPPADSKAISSIRWKHGSSLVVDWNTPNFLTYYGTFNGRTTLDPKTLKLKIERLTLADKGAFSLETNAGSIVTYQVEVYKPPPQPIIKRRPLVCEDSCQLQCAVDNQDLGPITYEWKINEGEWTEGDKEKNISRSSNSTTKVFFCRLITRVGTSKASAEFENPFHKPVDTTFGPLVVAAIVIAVVLLAIIAGIIAMVYFWPNHPFSESLKKWIPCFKKDEHVTETNGKKEDQGKEKEVLTTSSDPGTMEMGGNDGK